MIPSKLIRDDSCHWYLIPYDQVENFERWVQDMEECVDSDFDFSGFMIDSPESLLIFHWKEL